MKLDISRLPYLDDSVINASVAGFENYTIQIIVWQRVPYTKNVLWSGNRL